MNFITLSFVFFFFFVLAMSAIFQRGSFAYKCFLLFFNIIFYAHAGTAFLPLLFFVAFINYFCAKHVFLKEKAAKTTQSKERRRKIILACTILLNVCLLAFYKYYEFILLHLEGFFNLFGMSSPFFDLMNESTLTSVAFPIGLSFYIFQGLSYSIDQYRNPKIKPQSFFNVLLYVSFFPTILAGPLMRGHDFFAQLQGETQKDSRLSFKNNKEKQVSAKENAKAHPQSLFTSSSFVTLNFDTVVAFTYILSGLFKKVVLASYLSEHIVRDVFQSPEFYSSPAILLAIYAYAMQIYCDFSGYTDIAIGIGALMGYHLPQNFNAPYLACSLQEFWRRWHITLSTWLRDYLYIPLGGNKKGLQSVNLMITMTLGGLWHGSHLHYIIWGFMHGVGLSVVHIWKKFFGLSDKERALKAQKEKALKASLRKHDAPLEFGEETKGGFARFVWRLLCPFRTFLAWFCTFHFVCTLWVFFRASDTENAFYMLEKLVSFTAQGDGFDALVPVVIAVAFSLQFLGIYFFRAHVWFLRKLWTPLQIIFIAIFIAFILKMGPDGVMPFIYFSF